jgi:hypothetical protein
METRVKSNFKNSADVRTTRRQMVEKRRANILSYFLYCECVRSSPTYSIEEGFRILFFPNKFVQRKDEGSCQPLRERTDGKNATEAIEKSRHE